MKKIPEHLNKNKFGLMFVFFILGIMLATQFRLTRQMPTTFTSERTALLARQVAAAEKKHKELVQEVEGLRSKVSKLTEEQDHLKAYQDTLTKYQILAGTLAVEGRGIEVILDDAKKPLTTDENPNLYVIHDADVLLVLNELRAAGAEALGINGERVTAMTEIRCIGPTILMNKTKRIAAPFVIQAIGNPDALRSSLMMPGGVYDQLKDFITINIKTSENIKIKALTPPDFAYLKEGEK
ncbi:DUF881 domain-containing protein [Carboxydothermus pertinax]|uniref:Division initiation protein n=1 Tax=Carboxydothermus pertinax TaxID=870242 RepID=A0A1L8CS83_9THEO|nr:DUF881 domain-containing protein [Carboxydothermus pertinax]GAV21780.1 hypothetical protein cpu_02900 [Carboxydothermus pertinax]